MSVQSSALRSLRDYPISLSCGQRCPYCHGDVAEEQLLLGCPDCLVVLHYLCAPDGKCTTLGCGNGPRIAPKAPGRPVGTPLTPPKRSRLSKLRLLALSALCFGVGFAACYSSEPEVVILPPPPPVQVAQLTLQVDRALAPAGPGLARLTGVVTLDSRNLPATRGDYYAPLQVFVSGKPASLSQASAVWDFNLSQVPFSALIPAASGWHDVLITANWGGGSSQTVANVFLEPPPVVVDPGPEIVRQLVVPTRVTSDLLIIEGVVNEDLAWADVTIAGPMGQVPLAHLPPGPFTGAVTLPGPGSHAISVTVTDPHGNSRVYRQVVVR